MRSTLRFEDAHGQERQKHEIETQKERVIQGEHGHAEVVSEAGNRRQHLHRDAVFLRVFECGGVDLDLIEWQLLERAQR